MHLALAVWKLWSDMAAVQMVASLGARFCVLTDKKIEVKI
jgi:hypothetical protein